MFREQRDKTTPENVTAGCSPAVESMFSCAQPKIYALLRLVAFAGLPDTEGDDVDDCCPDDDDGDDACEKTMRACDLVAGLEDKATLAHMYHYYSLKLGEIWNENRVLLSSSQQPPLPVESQSVAVMTDRRVYLTALIRTVRSRVAVLHQRAGDSVRRPVVIIVVHSYCNAPSR